MRFLDLAGLQYFYGKVADRIKAVQNAIPTKTSQLTNDSGFKTTDNNTTYALSKSGTTITLTGSDGSKTSVTDADTNTTYSAATTSEAGLMSASDKSKLDGITANADAVSFAQSLTSGTQVGTITINGTATKLYAPTNTDTTYDEATTSKAGLMSASDKTKLNGIATGAEVNQNAFSNITVGGTTIAADAKTDTLTLVAGSNVTLTPDATNDKITIAATDTTYSAATTSSAGLMSASDKSKLDGITASADAVSVSRSVTSGTKIGTITVNGTAYDLYAPKSDASGAADSALESANTYTDTAIANLINSAPTTLDTLGEIADAMEENAEVVAALEAAIGGKANAVHDHSAATTSAAGFMSTSDKTKLNGIATGAEVNQNAFSNIVIGSTTIAADAKTDTLTLVAGSNVTLTPDATNDKVTIAATNTTYSAATTSAAGLMSASDKSKLDAITASADSVAFTQSLTSGTQVGTITINGTATKLYAPTNTDTTYDAATTSKAGLMSASDKSKLDATNVAYGTCSTAAATAAKVVTVSGNTNWVLAAGSSITVLFSNTNTASNPTLNVNGTGAKNVYYGSSQITTSSLGYAGTANRPMTFVYDGTQYRFVGWGYDSNTTYTNVKLGHGYVTCSTAAATTAKVGTLSSYTLTTGGIVAVKFTNAVPASATLNINSKGAKAIYHRGAAIKAGVINAGDTATFIYNGSQYHLLSIDRDENMTYDAITTAQIDTILAEIQ